MSRYEVYYCSTFSVPNMPRWTTPATSHAGAARLYARTISHLANRIMNNETVEVEVKLHGAKAAKLITVGLYAYEADA